MSMTPIGDLAQQLMLKTRSTSLTTTVSRLTQELASNQASNVAQHLGGDVSHLMDIDRDLSQLKTFDMARVEAAGRAAAMQSSLEVVQKSAEALSESLFQVSSGNSPVKTGVLAEQARGSLDTMMSALNSSFAGRSLFAGVSTDRAPLKSSEELINQLKQVAAGQTTASGVRTAVENWFNAPNGFDAVIYAGSQQSLAAFQVGASETVDLSTRADAQVFKDLLSDTALVVLAEELNVGLDAQKTMQSDARSRLVNTSDQLTESRAKIGYTEARLEEIGTRNAASRASLEQSRSALIGVDPYDTAIRLEEARFQLESLYTVTARNASLSLLNHLR